MLNHTSTYIILYANCEYYVYFHFKAYAYLRLSLKQGDFLIFFIEFENRLARVRRRD